MRTHPLFLAFRRHRHHPHLTLASCCLRRIPCCTLTRSWRG